MPASTAIPDLLCYEDLVEAESGDYAWPEFDENSASRMCYTSRHHRQSEGRASTATARPCCTPMPRRCRTRWACRRATSVLPVVPMFHVNAWGIPYSAALIGAKLVLPGRGTWTASRCTSCSKPRR